MDRNLFDGVVVFVAVASEGSFRGAAARLGLTPAAVSKSIKRLEEDLGARLFNRTTRRVAITAEGSDFLAHCEEAMGQMRLGRETVAQASGVARGAVRISASPVLTQILSTHAAAFARSYPQLVLHLEFTDVEVNLVESDVDVAIRIGQLPDSALVGRVVRRTGWRLVASPDYLDRRGAPQSPSELEQHACLLFRGPQGRFTPWRVATEDGVVDISPAPALTLTDGNSLVLAAAGGAGICQAFDFVVEGALKRGELVEVLATSRTDGPPITALTMPGGRSIPRIRAAVDWAVSVLS